MVIKNNETLLIIGDSVTDCERVRPIGEGEGGIGNGYPRNVQALLDMNYPNQVGHMLIAKTLVDSLGFEW